MKIFKKIGLILCSLVLAVGSFFLPFKSNQKSYLAFADDITETIIYQYHSNDFYSIDLYYDDWSVTRSYPCLFKCDFTYNSLDNSLFVYPVLNYITSGTNKTLTYSSTTVLYRGSRYSEGFYFNSSGYDTWSSCSFNYNSQNGDYFYSFIYADTGFNSNIYKVSISSQENDPFDNHVSSTEDFLVIRYFDVNEKQFYFCFNVPENFVYEARTYYLGNPSLLTDSQYYSNGYADGLNANQPNIYNQGYSDGESAGYSRGFNQGVLDSNDYSFIGLIGAVFDVPLKTFQGALNYDLLGINLFNLFTALLTLSLIIFIVKIVLGGK